MEVARRLWSLLDSRSRSLAVGLFLMMCVAAGLEGLGVGVIMPFLAMLTEADSASGQWVFGRLQALPWVTDRSSAIVAAATCLIALYLVKNTFLLLTDYAQFRFVFTRHIDVATKLFRAYMRRPYEEHMKHSTAEMLRNVDYDVRLTFSNVFVPSLVLCVEVLTALAIGITLFLIDPLKTSFVMALLVGVTGGFYWAVRRKSIELGEMQQLQQGKMIQWLTDGIHAFKEIRVGNKERYFVDGFRGSGDEFARVVRYHRTIKAAPSRLIEVLGIAAILVVVITAIAQGQEPREILPALGVFVAAGVRLMPSANRIITSVTTIRHFYPALEVVSRDFARVGKQALEPAAEVEPSRSWERVTFTKVSYRYPDATTDAVRDLSFEIARGESVAIVGPSGAGKTTVADLLLGLLEPTSGTVALSPRASPSDQPLSKAIAVGYVPQPAYLLDETVRRNVAFGFSEGTVDDDRVRRALRLVRLEELVQSMPQELDTHIGRQGERVSGGQGQRLGIARALYDSPDLLILDEATSSRDNETEREVSDAIMGLAGEKTLFVIAHRLATVRRCDRVLMLVDGKLIAQGTYDSLLGTSDDFQQLVRAGEIHP